MDKITKIKQRRDELITKPDLQDRKERLISLIDKHGVEAVSAASGISIASLVTYTRTKEPKISDENLTIAEKILSELK